MPSVARVERRLAYQAMDAGLGPEPAIGVLAIKTHRRALDARDLPLRDLHDLGLESFRLTPSQVHAQQHVGPVLGFGSAGTRLDIDVGAVGVHLAREHATELETSEIGIQRIQFRFSLTRQFVITFFSGEFQDVGKVRQPGLELLDGEDDAFKLRALPAQFLGILGVVPDLVIRELKLYLREAFLAVFVVKGTP